MIKSRVDVLIPSGHPNNPGRRCEKILASVFHYTANDNLAATDTANAKYFARKFIKKDGHFFEADGKTPFRYGSTNKIIDADSVTTSIPIGQGSYHAGDRQLSYENGFKGQTELAAKTFGHNQNFLCVSYEMCNNDNWLAVIENTIEEAARDIVSLGIDPNKHLYLRHGDLTGKKCPRYFVENQKAFDDFVSRIKARAIELKSGESEVLEKQLKDINSKIAELSPKLSELTVELGSLARQKAILESNIKSASSSLANLPQTHKVNPECYITQDSLNLRSQPSFDPVAKVKIEMPKGSKFYVLEVKDSWARGFYKDIEGWARVEANSTTGKVVYLKKEA